MDRLNLHVVQAVRTDMVPAKTSAADRRRGNCRQERSKEASARRQVIMVA
jgi:hypothetical protein